MDAKDRQIERLERLVAKQEQVIAQRAAMIDKLPQRVDKLKRQLAEARKGSSTSSKPLSSDIVEKAQSKESERGNVNAVGKRKAALFCSLPSEEEVSSAGVQPAEQ